MFLFECLMVFLFNDSLVKNRGVRCVNEKETGIFLRKIKYLQKQTEKKNFYIYTYTINSTINPYKNYTMFKPHLLLLPTIY